MKWWTWRKWRLPGLLAGGLTAVLAAVGTVGGCALTRMGNGPDASDEKRFSGWPNWRDGKFRNAEPVRLDRKKIAKGGGMFRFLWKSANGPAIPPEVLRPRFGENPIPGAAVWWFGHSTLVFELGGTRFITDPVFGNAAPVPGVLTRFTPPPLRADELPKLDFILISHDHYDHLEYDFIRSRRNTGERFVTSPGVGARLRGWGIATERITELNWGDTVRLGGVRVTAVESRHFSGRTLNDRDRTLWSAFVLEGGGKKIFFGADGGYGRHFAKIGKQHGPFDLVCLEIDAWNERWPDNHLFPHQFPTVFAELGGRAFLPIHYGVFDLALHPWGESLAKVKKHAAEHHIPLHTPLAGGRVDLGASAEK